MNGGEKLGMAPAPRDIARDLEKLLRAVRDAKRVQQAGGSSFERDRGVESSEPLAETPYARAIERCRHGMRNKQGAERGDYDADIRELFVNYLASRYPSASMESIENHASDKMRRVRSWFRVAAWNTAGTAGTALLTSIAPKLGIYMGANAAAIGAGMGITLGSAAIPALLAALPIAGAFGATYITRQMTRDSRESRKAGNILREAMRSGSRELENLRKAVANGSDVFKEFDTLMKKHDRMPEKKANWLWTTGMLATGGILGTIGAGSVDIAGNIVGGKGGIIPAIADWKDSLSQFAGQFWKSETNPGAWGTGVRELSEWGKFLMSHVAAMTWLSPTPDWKPYLGIK